MYYPCSENKGADQLRGYREADLRLCFRICIMQIVGFLIRRLIGLYSSIDYLKYMKANMKFNKGLILNVV